MGGDDHLLLLGASVRAAAFSAVRAGLHPWGADLFADTDLRALCPAVAIPPAEYPQALLRVAAAAPPGPWLYTGALENRPGLVHALSVQRTLWGNGAAFLCRARNPVRIAWCLRTAGLAHPQVRLDPPGASGSVRWLAKPVSGAGGRGIAFFSRDAPRPARRTYFQQYLEGTPCAAVYVGDGARALLLGVTRQLVGEPWLHAAPFHYCGSVGPLSLAPEIAARFREVGAALAVGLRLRGLFGVDCVLRDGVPWPIELNPRYTASVEVLEHATGLSALALHRRAFDRAAPAVPTTPMAAGPVVGKAVLFAQGDLLFPSEGPWQPASGGPLAVDVLPEFADVPPPGQAIPRGRPVLTCFAAADSVEECLQRLQAVAGDLDRGLFGR
jgi:predicted ATP-grasp superfamily ATP-dependent carboligase